MVFPAEARGFTPDGADTEQKIPQGLIHEDLVNLVGPDYQEILDRKAVLSGLINEGESLLLNYPPSHAGSDGEYVFEGKIKEHWVFVYVLRNKPQVNGESKKGRTSKHKHKHERLDEFVEDYYVLKGEMSLFLGEGDLREKIILNEENDHTRVPVDTFHTAESSDTIAFVLVVNPNSSHIPREELHSS